MKYNVNKRFNCDNKFPPLKKNIPKYIIIFLLLILISYLNCKEIRKVSTITGFSVTGVRTFWTCPLKICFLFIDAFSNFFFWLVSIGWVKKRRPAISLLKYFLSFYSNILKLLCRKVFKFYRFNL